MSGGRHLKASFEKNAAARSLLLARGSALCQRPCLDVGFAAFVSTTLDELLVGLQRERELDIRESLAPVYGTTASEPMPRLAACFANLTKTW